MSKYNVNCLGSVIHLHSCDNYGIVVLAWKNNHVSVCQIQHIKLGLWLPML